MLQAKSLTKYYTGAAKPALDELNVHIKTNEFVSLLGRSGSGKSTLLNILSSLVLPDAGEVLFEGQNICAFSEFRRNQLRQQSFAMVFQQHHLMPYLTALENVLLPSMRSFKPVPAEQYAIAHAMLEKVGLGHKGSSKPGQLSGGEQQRVAIARALARGAKVLFADEPTGSLDSATGAAIMDLLLNLNSEGVTVVMVTHNPEYAKLGHRSVIMADGRIVG